jgi:hypothetical protein
VVDVLIAAGWVLVLAQYDDIYTTPQWATALGVTVLAGLISGRYRVIFLAAIAAVVLVLIGTDGCGAGCEDEDPLWFEIVFGGIVLLGWSLVMALGVFLRKEWRRRFLSEV